MVQATTKEIVISTDEKQLLEQLRQSDEGALKAIFMEHHRDLCRVAYRVVHDADLARDCVQDVFLRLWVRRSSLQITTSLHAYLRRAVVNTAINALQARKASPLDETHHSTLIAHREEDHEYNELRELADRAIQHLPARTRAVFQLIRGEGLTYREVSEHLDISEKAVEKEMMKALRLLRQALKDYLVVLLFLKIFP